MSFTGIPFVIFFVIVLATYHLAGKMRVPDGLQWGWLVAASLFFYGYETPRLLWLLGFSILFNSLAGWFIARRVNSKNSISRWFMAGALGVNLLLIVSFKYAGLLGSLLLPADAAWAIHLQNQLEAIPLPIGISFYTFHAISFLVDLSRAGTKEPALIPFCEELSGTSPLRGLGKLALYITFFPQLIAGPIMKARAFLPQIGRKRTDAVHWQRSCRLLILGYFLKMVVADNLQEQTNLIATAATSGFGSIDLLLLLYAYSFQIFADFAGYSLIALGLAGLCGYQLPINFNFPYLSASITEFWRRWHISLSTWLRDYLYFPLGGNRKGAARTYLNLFLVMFLGGLWHGSEMRYAWWGTGHGLLLAIERLLDVAVDETSVLVGSFTRWLRVLLTFQLVSFLWLLFIMPDMKHVTDFLGALIANPITFNLRMAYAILVYSLPVFAYYVWGYYRPRWREAISNSNPGRLMESACYAAMLYLIITNPGAGGNFIYFQF